MTETNSACPTVPRLGFGTVGQGRPDWDRTRDSGGTSSLKRLAAAVLTRNREWDTMRDAPATPVPTVRPLVPLSPVLAAPSLPPIPGVPLHWREGVALLATRPAPPTIPPRRWAALAASAFRLVRDHGAELHAAGWNALDLFGLHPTAPAANPAGWGLAWLLGAAGEVLDVAPEAIGIRQRPSGARLTLNRRQTAASGSVIPAWSLLS